MTTEELEKIVSRHEMQRLELKEGVVGRCGSGIRRIRFWCAIFLFFASAGHAFAAWDVFGCSFTDNLSFPRSEEIRGMDLAVLGSRRHEIFGVGFSLWTSKYWSVYGIQTALLHPYAEKEFWGVQCGLVSAAKYGGGIQLGLLNYCSKPRYVFQAGAVNIGQIGFMNDNGCIGPDWRRLQIGLLNQSVGGVQIGAANFGGSLQIGLCNVSDSGLKIGLVNFGSWITPIIGW